MDAKEYLMSLKHIEVRIRNMSEELQRYNDIATNISARMDGERVQTSLSGDKLSMAVAKIVDLEKEIYDEIEHLKIVRRDIIDKISTVENPMYRDVLYMRYVNHLTFEQIAVNLDKSWRHIIRVHGYALKNFSKKIKKD